MVHSDDKEYAKTDKIVMVKKDENVTLKKYFDTVRVYTNI
jgi:hypothetical protein